MELRLSALLSLCLLLGLVCPGQARAARRCPHKQTCNKCIQAGPECAWCGRTELTAAQCNTEEKLVAAGCGGHIYNPKGGLLSIANESRRQEGGPVQVTVVRLNLRPGVVQSVPLNLSKGQQKTTEVTLETSPVPEHVSIAFNDTDSPWLKQVNVEAISCPHGRNESWTVTVTPKGFPLLLELQLTLECVCECMKDREKSSPACGGRGALECGRCLCIRPYSGGRCETRRCVTRPQRLPPPPPPPTPGDEQCRDGPEAPLCSGRGVCEEGVCVCDSRADRTQQYNGRHCECSNFDCLYSENKLCGGHGRCSCGQCDCDVGWTGKACDCSMDMGPCLGAYQNVCSHRGMCVCATCVCQEPFRGATCEHSPY